MIVLQIRANVSQILSPGKLKDTPFGREGRTIFTGGDFRKYYEQRSKTKSPLLLLGISHTFT
jgi:hypothetical protein